MSMFEKTVAPAVPYAGREYDPAVIDRQNSIFRLFFNTLCTIQKLNITGLNINIDKLPTQADLANLRVGDVYRDTTASNVLKVKV